MKNLLKMARLNVGFSLEEAAKELKINVGYLSQIENGHRQVGSERANELAKLYGVRKEDIFLPSRYAVREVEDVTSA
ncbi:helix-turn-helix transcriptional regulator [Paenibacillus sp. RC84]|uniref:helix-turn-helix transcriptional regulator n=1 Tax=Paenibacillus sp. RC84 TaxID=3156252 RepID=UPI0035121B60